jgi:hypothetical protein
VPLPRWQAPCPLTCRRCRVDAAVNIDDIVIEEIPCECTNMILPNGVHIRRIASATTTYMYIRRLQKALMGAVYLAVLCDRERDLAAVPGVARASSDSGRCVLC